MLSDRSARVEPSPSGSCQTTVPEPGRPLPPAGVGRRPRQPGGSRPGCHPVDAGDWLWFGILLLQSGMHRTIMR